MVVLCWVFVCSIFIKGVVGASSDNNDGDVDAELSNEIATYELTVYTGVSSQDDAGTTSQVHLFLKGEHQEKGIMTEKFLMPFGGEKLHSGSTIRIITDRKKITQLGYLGVCLKSYGKSPTWFLDKITVSQQGSSDMFYFHHGGWLPPKVQQFKEGKTLCSEILADWLVRELNATKNAKGEAATESEDDSTSNTLSIVLTVISAIAFTVFCYALYQDGKGKANTVKEVKKTTKRRSF